MASKKLTLRLGKTYITRGGHLVTPIEKCSSCGLVECRVRKNGKFVRPHQALWYMESDKTVSGKHPNVTHYHLDGKLNTWRDDNTRKASAFDVVAVWEE